MKKTIFILLLLTLIVPTLKAQTFAEWFEQKKTQKKYLLQQIAALQVYIGYARKGYNIAKEGLTAISGFTNGEFNLHTDYFNSLKTVNPVVKRYTRIAEIIALQINMVQSYNRTYTMLNNSNAFSGDELEYIGRVFSRLLADCDHTLDELIMITTDGKVAMKDDERFSRIDKLYLDMQDKSTFCQSFASDAQSLAASRIKEKTDIQTSRALHGIKSE